MIGLIWMLSLKEAKAHPLKKWNGKHDYEEDHNLSLSEFRLKSFSLKLMHVNVLNEAGGGTGYHTSCANEI